MIAITPPRKKLPLDELARTESGETAYFIDPTVLKPSDESAGRDAVSSSKEEWLPVIKQPHRLTAFIAGNPGAGKSYLATDLIELLPKDSEVLLFTALEENDGNFDRLKNKIWKIKMDPEVLGRLSLSIIRSRCKKPVLLFDDVDKIRDKTVEKLVFALMEDALANGRGHKKHDGEGDIHVICTSHALNDYRKTKYTLENSDYVCIFPQSTTFMQMRRMFDKLGLSKELCDTVIKLGRVDNIRRVIIKKVAPMYMIAGENITLI